MWHTGASTAGNPQFDGLQNRLAIYYNGKLVELREDADPELQRRVESARRAMAALSGEG